MTSAAPACESTQPVNFSVSPDPLNTSIASLSLGTPNTNTAGVATIPAVSTSGWASGGYTLTVTYAGTTVCGGSTGMASLAVTAPGQFAYGYGSYTPSAGDGLDELRVRHRPDQEGHQRHLPRGLELATPGKWLFQANVTSLGLTGTQGLLAGTGSLYWWNTTLNKARGGWQLARSGVRTRPRPTLPPRRQRPCSGSRSPTPRCPRNPARCRTPRPRPDQGSITIT